ncbi:MAG: outer membrane protein transport protein [Verrucomicrobiaceae bacterium]|nr:outer membrane protein transport protein [Verrucomicrobiaceae bacterium]
MSSSHTSRWGSRLAAVFAAAATMQGYAAEGVRTLPDSAGALGMVGGRQANLRDPSVTRSNPANLQFLREDALMINVQPWYGQTDFDGVNGTSDSMIQPWKPLGSFYAVMPVNDDVTFGFGITAPFGIAISWPRDGAFRYSAPYDAVLQTAAINPAVGIKISDAVNFGVGLDIFYSRLKLDQAYPWAAALGVPAADGDMTFEGDGWGLGAYAGFTIQLAEHHRLAITGRLPVTVDYEGDFTISNMPAALRGLYSSRSDFKSQIEHPASIGVGYGVDLSDKITFGLDYEWIQNSAHTSLPLNVGKNQALLPVSGLDLEWRDSYTIGGGFEYKLTPAWMLRAGYMFSKSPLRDRTFTPSIPTNDRHLFSIGTGYTFGRNTIDFAYSFVPMETRHVRTAATPAFNGDYEIEWHVFSLSYTRRF